VERKSGDLAGSMASVKDKVPEVESRYVTRDLLAFLESYPRYRRSKTGSPLI